MRNMLRSNQTCITLKQVPIVAIAALSLTLSPASVAGTCTTADLTTSTVCLDDVSTGQGGNVTEAMMNAYASDAGAFGSADWEFVDKIESFDQSDDFVGVAQNSTNSVFSFTSVDNGSTGTWTLSGNFAPGASYAFVLKGGPDSATYLMDTSFTYGTWNVGGISGELSNVTLFKTPSAVPLPAAAWLFGSAILGMAGIGWRRKANA